MKIMRFFLKDDGNFGIKIIFFLVFSLLTQLSFSAELLVQKKEALTQKQLFAKIQHLFPADVKGFQDLKTGKFVPVLKELLKLKNHRKFMAGAVTLVLFESAWAQKRIDIVERLLDEKITVYGYPAYKKIEKAEYLKQIKKQLSQENNSNPLISFEKVEVFGLDEAENFDNNIKEGKKLGQGYPTGDLLWVKVTMMVINQKEPEIKYLLIRETGAGWKITGV
jgi:hypothetical protein